MRGWRVEGEPAVALAPAHGALIGLALPAGKHAVRLRYRPAAAVWGVGAGIAALALLLAAGFLPAPRVRR